MNMKVADIESILRTGLKIEIKPYAPETKCYEGCTWWIENGVIWTSSKELGTFPRNELTVNRVAKHLRESISEGFQLCFHQ